MYNISIKFVICVRIGIGPDNVIILLIDSIIDGSCSNLVFDIFFNFMNGRAIWHYLWCTNLFDFTLTGGGVASTAAV